jgi:hypothetical protein
MDRGPGETIRVTEEFERLDALGVLPPKCDVAVYADAKSPADGLLALWKEWLRLAPKTSRSRAARIHCGLAAAVADGAELTFQIPGRDRDVCERWLGDRVYWWPRGVIEGPRVGIVGSRLKRDSESRKPILKALRLSMTAIDSQREQVVTSAGTSLCDYVAQCGLAFGTSVLRVSAPGEQVSSKSWLDQIVRPSDPAFEYQLFLSPEVSQSRSVSSSNTVAVVNPLNRLPLRDRTLALMSSRLFVLTLRQGGNWWELLNLGFADQLWAAGTVRSVVGPGLCAEDVVSELQNHEVVPWYLSSDADHKPAADRNTRTERVAEDNSAALPVTDRAMAEDALIEELIRSEATSEWLLHWTRAPRGEWAGESQDDYLMDVVLSDASHLRTALGTLQRIVAERVIRTTSGNTRVSADVVCLSATPLVKLVAQRTFRQHRGRWDFEHYGIGVRRASVCALGGRPVIYGDESVWQSLPQGEQPWFQPRQSRSTRTSIDWTIESEWRLTSELSLDRLSADDVFVFCSTEDEAEELRSTCEWRVVAVETLNARSQRSDDIAT